MNNTPSQRPSQDPSKAESVLRVDLRENEEAESLFFEGFELLIRSLFDVSNFIKV